MLKADRQIFQSSILSGFTFLFLFSSIGGVAEAKNKTMFSFSSAAQNSGLEYPEFPAALMDRVKGKPPSTPAEAAKPDSMLSQDWALPNIGFFEVFSRTAQPLNPKTAPCSNQIVVAVVDTGIDYTHKELVDSVWTNPGESGNWEPPVALRDRISCRDKSCNGLDDDGNGFVDDFAGWDFVHNTNKPWDTHGHGTHIAGIVSAAGGNGIGTSGVCPSVRIMPLKYYDNSGVGYNNLNNTVRAIHYAVKMGAHIINYSGGGADPAQPERLAVEEARRRGILFVAAAGNDGHSNDLTPYYPESYPLDNIIGVASVNRLNQLLPSSNFGRTVHIAAPGLGILSTLPDGRFGTMSGTSQATAFVTGAAALLASQLSQSKQGFDYRKIKAWLIEGTKPMRGNDAKTIVSGGLLSIPQALAVQRDDMRRGIVSAPELATRPAASRNRAQ